MTSNKKQKTKRNPLIFNMMVMPCPSHMHPANWAKPGDENSHYKDLDYWLKLAKLAEKAKFNAIFIADVLGPYDVYNGPHNIDAVARSGAQFPLVDPSAFVSAMAATTETVSFGVTFSTIAEPPYLFARRLATLDHLSKGRIGWNIVTSYLQSAARNLLDEGKLPPHDKRYDKAEDYLETIYELLLSSWRDDAVVVNRETRTYAEPSRIREINHEGEFYNVPGPFVTEPSPQRLPVLLQAGTSPKGQDFAARNAEVVFLMGFSAEELKKSVDSIRAIAINKYGRARENLKFITGTQIILGKTHEEAEAKFYESLKYHDTEGKLALLSGWTGIDFSKFNEDQDLVADEKTEAMYSAVKTYITESKRTRKQLTQQIGVGTERKRLFVGTPQEVADEIEKYVDIAGLDGFNLVGAHFPEGFEDIVELLVPELKRRGLLWEDYAVPGGTFRENIFGVKGKSFVPEDHVAHGYRWRSDETKEEFEQKLQQNKAKYEELKLK